MVDGLEHVSRLIARYATFEVLYRHRDSDASVQLETPLVELYALVLVFLSEISRYFDRSTGSMLKENRSVNSTLT